jgi:hypothetical protein
MRPLLASCESMIPKSVQRFSEKIMLQQGAKSALLLAQAQMR